ncbi:phytoene synthase [Gordonia araii NBRC 100433]|uniref:Phytoene synthase n=1 Tax=Gordonia araii NBRC 100433 TaxID=1073574 RepID=G7H7N4_9ACTN|nr:phytoene/squalene synthase family protein [Gordonia araii]NNG97855.1 phytoene/squalene synthase family protein [Gordonia araii NBRC 100433]GAB11859.1 phytoene synthase [Gordonia araii NBRC 100433]
MSADPERGYRIAARLSARHGRTYHLAATLLPRRNRRAVHALYGFARVADDIVDVRQVGESSPVARLDELFAGLDAALRGMPVHSSAETTDLLAAVADSVAIFDIDPAYFTDFERSMRMDLPSAPEFTPRYLDMAHLREYTRGSAAVIGLMLVRVLGADPDDPVTATGAAMLGEAFQLTNFLRDVAEDLDRDRIYLPADDLAAFGVDEAHLRACRARGETTPQLRRALAHLAAVNRDWYHRASPAIDALPGRTRPAIRAAARSYADILRVLAENHYEVFSDRAVVGVRTRLRHAAAALF